MAAKIQVFCLITKYFFLFVIDTKVLGVESFDFHRPPKASLSRSFSGAKLADGKALRTGR